MGISVILLVLLLSNLSGYSVNLSGAKDAYASQDYVCLLYTSSGNINIVNYENALIEKYENWEEQLDEREEKLKERENALQQNTQQIP